MADVTVISSSIVRPENINQSCREKIHLTPFDYTHVDYTQRGLLFPKPDPETRFISRLKTSLSSALDVYFPFAGRLGKVDNQDDSTVSFHVDCNGSAAKFVHAIAESVSPLLALQVTEMKDGVFISFGYNHMVADGASIWNFFRAWSKICSNGQSEDLDRPLVLKGWFVDGIDFPIRIPVSEIQTKMASSGEKSTEGRVFHFTKRNISDLKAKSTAKVALVT
ncbi:unnamed protein product [Thlaspi arvense]|uniref:Uncharacterized protein n=1 Tax=Thlaspi arvense TaxID=13288 RepID=A0AAU9SI45_THLAR|nr:unnamed protein product [Thlaspi arvense]